MTLRTRTPSGRTPWPLILLEGPEKSGKSWMAALLSASPRVGRTIWVELGSEGTADQYGAIPNVRYEVAEHNGTWRGLTTVIRDVREEAAKVPAGEPPMVLVVDTATAEWDLLKSMAETRARGSQYGRKILERDPDADVPVDRGHWTYVTDQHYESFIEPLKTFPGVVVLIARGKEISATDDKGKPIAGSREYKVEGQKNLAFDCDAWLRLSRSGPPTVVGIRSVVHAVRPGRDKPIQDPEMDLEKLIFTVLGCDAATSEPGKVASRSELDAAKVALWDLAKQLGWDQKKLADEFARENDGQELGTATVEQFGAMADELRLLLAQPESAAPTGEESPR